MSDVPFASMIASGQIAFDLKAEERWPAIVELVELLESSGKINSGAREGVLEALYEREEQISTAIGLGVAIPHAFTDGVDEPVVAYGFSRSGLDFESLDNAPVEFIVLILAPKNQSAQHLKTLATIAKLFHNDEVRERLRDCVSEAEVLEVLRG